VLENISASAFAEDDEFRNVASDYITAVLLELQKMPLVDSSSDEGKKLIATVRSLRDAQQHLSVLGTPLSTPTL
jgi:hypothetical protein